jgi:hypothetical protein
MIDLPARKYNIVQASRASAILYHLLVSQQQRQTWLLPANICPIVPITFLKAGVPFELVDISAANLHMDLEQVEALVKKRKVGGLLYAHTYGDISTPDDFFQSLKSINPELIIVDDRCLCIPEFEVSSSADVVLYSTGYAKIVELGFGGYAFLRDSVQYQSNHLPFNSDHHDKLEYAYKQALSLHEIFVYRDSDWLETDRQLPSWHDYLMQIEAGIKSSMRQRALLNQIYAGLLPVEIQLPQRYQSWRFNIRLKNKERVLKAIFDEGLFASSHYASLAGIMSNGRAVNAERLADEVVNLFNDHHFDEVRAEKVCDLILKNA